MELKLKKGQYCLGRISVRGTLAAHLDSSDGSPTSPSDFDQPAFQLKRKPAMRQFLIFQTAGKQFAEIFAEQVGLLHVLTSNNDSCPGHLKSCYIPINPNACPGEPSIETTPAWKGNNSWQFCGLYTNVIVGRVSRIGPPTKIHTPSMYNVIQKQNGLKHKAVFEPPYPTDEAPQTSNDSSQTDSSSDSSSVHDGLTQERLPLVFTAVFDIWIGADASDLCLESYGVDYSLEEEMAELGLLMDNINDGIIVG
jgi:hypothetical protein